MILNDIADCACFFVELAPARHPEAFGHRDLHAFDVIAIPYGLEVSVRKSKKQQVRDRFLPEIVIDPEDTAFFEDCMQNIIQLRCGTRIAPKRLLDNDSRTARAS